MRLVTQGIAWVTREARLGMMRRWAVSSMKFHYQINPQPLFIMHIVLLNL